MQILKLDIVTWQHCTGRRRRRGSFNLPVKLETQQVSHREGDGKQSLDGTIGPYILHLTVQDWKHITCAHSVLYIQRATVRPWHIMLKN